MAYGNRAGGVFDEPPILTMPPQAQVLAGGVEGDFVAVEAVDPGGRPAHAHQQTHVGPAPVRQEDLNPHLAVFERSQLAHQLVAGGAGEVQLVPLHTPHAAVGPETLQG